MHCYVLFMCDFFVSRFLSTMYKEDPLLINLLQDVIFFLLGRIETGKAHYE